LTIVTERITSFRYFGTSISESEIIYDVLSSVFGTVEEEEIMIDDKWRLLTIVEIHFPVPYGNDFFSLFTPNKWRKIKGVIAEIKKRRGKRQMKLLFSFAGISGEYTSNAKLVLQTTELEYRTFETAIERVEVLVDLIAFQILNMPTNALEVSYFFDPMHSKWRPEVVQTSEHTYHYINNNWEIMK
jgi:hypothetical protein